MKGLRLGAQPTRPRVMACSPAHHADVRHRRTDPRFHPLARSRGRRDSGRGHGYRWRQHLLSGTCRCRPSWIAAPGARASSALESLRTRIAYCACV